MKATQKLHALGQSIWLDNITRDLLTKGTLKYYVEELSVTGLTSNPTIFDHAIKNSTAYDAAIRQKLKEGKSGEGLFFELALEDLTQAADLFRPIWDKTNGVDGWVSLEVSPLLAHDTASTLAAAKELHARARRPNLFIKIPGTKEGLPAIEEAIFAGVPVNVTLLFSREHYVAAAEAFLRGIERRIDAGLNPNVGSVASVFISRWDVAVMDRTPEALRDRLAGWRLRAPACPSSLGSLTPDARLAMDDRGDRRIGLLVSFVEGLIRRVAGAVRLDEPDHPRHGVRRFDYVAVTAGAHGSEHRRAQGWRIGNLRQHQRQAGRVGVDLHP